MILESKGFLINNFYVPSFRLKRGDFVILYIENKEHFFSLKEQLLKIFSGLERNSNVTINKTLLVVKNINLNGLKELVFPLTVKRYIEKNTKCSKNILDELSKDERITPNTKIGSLPGTSKKMISLLSTYSHSKSHSKNIILDLGGLDPKGAEQVVKEVNRTISENNGAAILIDSHLGFEEQCTEFLIIDNV